MAAVPTVVGVRISHFKKELALNTQFQLCVDVAAQRGFRPPFVNWGGKREAIIQGIILDMHSAPAH